MRLRVFAGFIAIATFALTSCKNGTSDINDSNLLLPNASNTESHVLRLAELTEPMSIFPQKLTQSVEGLISSQIFEGLVKVDPKTLKTKPGLAESWEFSPDGKIITFHLRKGVKFHTINGIEGTEVKTSDVKYTFQLLCTYSENNLHFATICKDRIVGANESYEASKSGQKIDLQGFKEMDDYTFTIELLNSPAIFLDILGSPPAGIISKTAHERDNANTKIGAGPFIFIPSGSDSKRYALAKNTNYYAKDKSGNSLPYLDSLIVTILPSAELAWQGFKNGEFDYIGSMPTDQLKDIVENNITQFKGDNAPYILERSAEMVSQFYVFNVHKKPFDNIKVRKAFNYAIDKNKLIEKVLYGQAFGPAINGLVPPTFDYYKTTEIQGYSFDPAKAKELLKEAGYPDGKGFPEVQLIVNDGNLRNNSIAVEIQKQLNENLGVYISFESLPNGEKFILQTRGEGNIYRDGWVADYPSPESFLSVFYGEPVESNTISYPNTTKYVNKDYDMYYKKGRDATDRDTAAAYFLKAEKILIEDAPLIPLWYESNYRLINSRVKNLFLNPLRHFDFTEVDIKDLSK